ncbi:MAG: carbon storage regulator [Sedimentisphaerales bacterium]|nr:carbon storage regulator [Sedimentisphaerales bacterium]
MLVLEPKPDEKIILFDTVSKTRIVIKAFRRSGNGNIELAFDAPEQVRISRERGSVNGNGKI